MAGAPPFLVAVKPLFIPRNRRMAKMITGNPFLWLIHEVIWLYICILFATAILSWLIAFNVVNMRNDFVRNVNYILHQVTEPALRPIRRFVPNLGGLDISFIVLWIGLLFLDRFVDWIYAKIFYGI
ncbi:MAG: YggT family protein [Pseudolabrys sp.]